jgi:phytoene desaturase
LSRLLVLGGGVGGLSAAIHARLKGWEVTLLEARTVTGGKAAELERDGYHLDPGPSIIILPEVYEALFTAAGRQMEDYLRFTRLDVLSRIFMEGSEPLDIPAQGDDCLALLESLSPSDASSMRTLLEKLDRVAPLVEQTVFRHPYLKPSDLLDARLLRFGMQFNPLQEYRKMVDRLFQLPMLRAFFYGFPSYGGQTYFAKSPSAFFIPYFMIRRGVFFPEGGVRAIPRALRLLAEEIGVQVRTGCRVVGLEGKSPSALASATLEDGETVSADAFVSNIDRTTLRRMLGEGIDPEPSYSYFTLHWGLRRHVPELDHHNLVIPHQFVDSFWDLYSKGVPPEHPIVYLNSTSALDREAAPDGCSNVLAVVTVPARRQDSDWEDIAPFRARVLSEMARVGLTFDPSDVAFEVMQTPRTFEERDGNHRGSLYGPSEDQRLWGLFPEPNTDPRWRNLTYCGGSVQPGAGLPMAVISGRFAIDSLGC